MGEILKIYGVNTVAFLSTLTTVDTGMKLILTAATLVYTLTKIAVIIKENFKGKK